MASTGRSSQGGSGSSRAGSSGARSAGGTGGTRGARGSQSGTRGASGQDTAPSARAAASGGAAAGGVGIGGSAEVGSGASGKAGTVGVSGSVRSAVTPGASASDSERQVPIGRERQQQGRPMGGEQATAQGGVQAYGTPFAFMRRFGEEMDRLFSDFGFGPTGFESELGLLGLPGSGGRSSVSLGASLPRGGQGDGRDLQRSAGGSAVRRPSSSAYAARSGWMPQVEVLQRGKNIVLRADLPGVRREDVHLEVEDDRLTISGERHYESESEEEGLYHSERSYGRFSRSIPLPPGTDSDAVEARFTDGVLEVTLPLPQEQSRARRIEIR